MEQIRQNGELYWALPKGKENTENNWIVVLFDDGKFRKIGTTHSYKESDFSIVGFQTLHNYTRMARLVSEQQKFPVKRPVDKVEKILSILRTLKDDFEGNGSLTDSYRQNEVQKIYRLMDALDDGNNKTG